MDAQPGDSTRHVVDRVRRHMEAHYGERICLADLATLCAISPYHLIRVFRRGAGLPPHAYLRQLRVRRASAMLQSGASVTSVAYRCGFADQAHFTRTFKRIVGVPPSTYAKAARESKTAA